jgi:hypothetical protein
MATKKRTPSQIRNLLEVRVRRIAASKGDDTVDEALREIILIAQDALDQRGARRST